LTGCEGPPGKNNRAQSINII